MDCIGAVLSVGESKFDNSALRYGCELTKLPRQWHGKADWDAPFCFCFLRDKGNKGQACYDLSILIGVPGGARCELRDVPHPGAIPEPGVPRVCPFGDLSTERPG